LSTPPPTKLLLPLIVEFLIASEPYLAATPAPAAE
jgi:hypothetical protein